MEFDINLVAVLVAAIAGMALGAAWYSRFLFGIPWMRLSGMTDAKIQAAKASGMGKSYAIAFIGSLIMAYVLAHFVEVWKTVQDTMGIQEALSLGFWLWLGFVAPVMLASVLWDGKPWKLYGINVGYQLVSLLVMAVILTLI